MKEKPNVTNLNGKFLIAMPNMGDSRFKHAVIYICSHNEDGTMGLIINKTAINFNLSDLIKQLTLPSEIKPKTFPINIGGPVEPYRGFILHTLDYVNEENFTSASKVKTPFTINEIDKEILKDNSHFKVYEPYRGFVNGRSSYFHNSISGYHAAKPKRIQDLYDFYLSKNKFNVLNMLNVKYLIDLNESNSLSLSVNRENLGNAWFIENLVKVESSNKEVLMLDNLNYSNDCLSTELENKTYEQDPNNKIDLISRKANELVYEYNSSSENFIVFNIF